MTVHPWHGLKRKRVEQGERLLTRPAIRKKTCLKDVKLFLSIFFTVRKHFHFCCIINLQILGGGGYVCVVRVYACTKARCQWLGYPPCSYAKVKDAYSHPWPSHGFQESECRIDIFLADTLLPCAP